MSTHADGVNHQMWDTLINFSCYVYSWHWLLNSSTQSVEYKSYPLMYNKAFSIETEGHLLNGSEVTVYTDDADLEQDLAKGEKDNIWLIHEILSNKMLTKPQQEFVNSASVVEAEIDCSGIMLG